MSAAKSRIRILIADDHPIVRKGLQSCLTCQDSLEVVGEASDGNEALEKALALIPDMVLLDISMPRRDGLAVTTALRKEAPQISPPCPPKSLSADLESGRRSRLWQ